MTQIEINQAQKLINNLSKNDTKCLKEIYGNDWKHVANPKDFGKKFKKAVESSKLTGLNHIGIRSTGRCDEYEKL